MTIDVEKKLTMSLDDIVAAAKPKRSARTPTITTGAGKKTYAGPIRKGRGATMKAAAQPYNKASGNYIRVQWQQQQQSSYGSGGKKNWKQQSGGGGSGYRDNQGKGSYHGTTSTNNKSWGGRWNKGGNDQSSWNQHDYRGNDYDDKKENNNRSYYARNVDFGDAQQTNNNATAITTTQQSRGGRRRVVVSNIPHDLTWREIKQAFSSVGTVVHCEVDSSGPKGAIANLTFSDPSGARQAVELYDGGDMNGRRIHVNYA
ncbi:RNA binding function, putative [Perkinsus marinus ATCC 50983]|uniref:RNA binding function, putative n=1 Tax=Perkinsus marinus (strain ATCC 50983 / TXsc) TaxID=423536 RepID=C5LLR0_PERM5|nr:RNA binding function, putative [Perkinsus marinus ATCC 50983]EER02282.1 RNA binding function, putative [Perkinsus marinus ATCC 50983]|eukprot:XP_002769564.1 RNA binding function, putative [Perkinsus marinus ATCC 50983]